MANFVREEGSKDSSKKKLFNTPSTQPNNTPAMIYEITFLLNGIMPIIHNNEEKSCADLVIITPVKIRQMKDTYCI